MNSLLQTTSIIFCNSLSGTITLTTLVSFKNTQYAIHYSKTKSIKLKGPQNWKLNQIQAFQGLDKDACLQRTLSPVATEVEMQQIMQKPEFC